MANDQNQDIDLGITRLEYGSALFILVMINGIATGYNLIADRKTQRSARERRAR